MQCSGAAVTSWEPVIADAGGVAAGRGEKYQGGSEGRRRKEELWRNGTMEKGVALTLDGLLFYPS